MNIYGATRRSVAPALHSTQFNSPSRIPTLPFIPNKVNAELMAVLSLSEYASSPILALLPSASIARISFP